MKKENSFISAVVLCAGNSTRMMENGNKQMISIKDVPVFLWSLKAFEKCDIVDEIIVVTKNELLSKSIELIKSHGFKKVRATVEGGKTRTQSSLIGVSQTDSQSTHVLIHDGARPFVSGETINKVVAACIEHGAAAPCTKISGTVKEVDDSGFSVSTINREVLRVMQTPQAFEKSLYLKAAAHLGTNADLFDDCQMVENIGKRVYLVEGNVGNLKITIPEDIKMIHALSDIEKKEF